MKPKLYNVRLKTADSGGNSYQEEFTFNVNNINDSPSEIKLSKYIFNENIASDSVIATLSTTDQDLTDSHTYELVAGSGDSDNQTFYIQDNKLKINEQPNYQTKSQYNIRLKTTDTGNLSYEKEVTLEVNKLNFDNFNISVPFIENTIIFGSGANDSSGSRVILDDGSSFVSGTLRRF